MHFNATRNRRFNTGIQLSAILLLGTVLRLYLLWLHRSEGIVDADEAVVGLMAKHISEGRGWPLIWYGQSYMGTLPSWLSAAGFVLFGVDATVVRAVPAALSVALIYSVYRLAALLYDEKTALMSALWVALPPTFLSLFSLKQPNYVAALVLGCWILIWAHRIACRSDQEAESLWLPSALGFTMGVALWVHFLTASFVASAVIWLCASGRRRGSPMRWARLGASCLVGMSPLLWHNVSHQAHSLDYLMGALPGQAYESAAGLVSRCYNLVTVVLPVLLGGRPLWSVERIGYTWWLPSQFEALGGRLLLLTLGVGVLGIAGPRLLQRLLGRGTASAASSSTGRWSLRLIAGIAMAVACLYLIQSAAPALRELRWSYFAGGRTYGLETVIAELTQPGMLICLLYGSALMWIVWSTLKGRLESGSWLLVLTLLLTLALYVGTRFGESRSPRYGMAIYVSAPIVLARSFRHLAQRWRVVPGGLLLGGVLLLHLTELMGVPARIHLQPTHYVFWQNLEASLLLPPSNRELASYLEARGMHHIYAKYWLALPTIFDSEEAIVAATGGPGRYPPYDDAVGRAERVAYVFHAGSFETQRFSDLLASRGIRSERSQVSVYSVFTDLTPDPRQDAELWSSVMVILGYP